MCVNYSMSALHASQYVNVFVTQLHPILCDLMGHSAPGFSVHELFWARLLAWVAVPSPRDLSNPRMESGSPTLQGDSLPSEAPGKPYIFNLLKKLLLLF